MESTNLSLFKRRLSKVRFTENDKQKLPENVQLNTEENKMAKLHLKIGKRKFVRATIETNLDIIKLREKLKLCTVDYLKISSLHGLSYVGDRRLSIPERIFWGVAFLAAVGASWASVSNLYEKYRESPIIVALSPTLIDIREVPFPAVTICNMNNLKKSYVQNALKSVKKGENNLERQMINSICKKRQHPDDMGHSNSTNYKAIVKLFERASQGCMDMIIGATWAGYELNINDTFIPTLTDEGMCCRFNAVKWDYIFSHIGASQVVRSSFSYDSFDWSPQRDYTGAPIDWKLPWRPQASGSNEGLKVYLDTDSKEYYCATGNSIGFKIMLHNPVETVKMTSFASIMEPGMETRIGVTPNIKRATARVVDVPLQKRKCYFESERQLRYYRTYSQRSCINECEANYTRDNCDCVYPFMPRDVDTKICEGVAIKCARDVLKFLEAEELNRLREECECLEGCFEVNYSTEESSCKLRSDAFEHNLFLANSIIRPNMTISDLAIISVYFERGEFIAVERRIIFGFTELLSTTGGVFGLFTGFSFLTIVEIFYHLVIKVYYSVKSKTRSNTINSGIPCIKRPATMIHQQLPYYY